MASVSTSDLKERILKGKFPLIFSSTPMPDLKSLGVYLLTKVIPGMEGNNEVAFCWHWAMSDVCAYSPSDYSAETDNYKTTHKMKCEVGDTVWHYDYTYKGKKRRCIITSEIWYKPGAKHSVSPIAMIYGQMMGNGLHISKCRWEDIE